MANLVAFKGVSLPDTTISLNHPVMRYFFRHQIQGLLNRFAGGLCAKRLLGSFQLIGVQSGGHLNKSHGAPPVRQHIGFCMTRSSREVLGSSEFKDEEGKVLSFELAGNAERDVL